LEEYTNSYPIQVTVPQELGSEPAPTYSVHSFVVRVRTPMGAVINIVEANFNTTLQEFSDVLQEKTQIPKAQQQRKLFRSVYFDGVVLAASFPPKVIPKDDMLATLKQLGIKNGDQLILKTVN
jgi:hypothetical protein